MALHAPLYEIGSIPSAAQFCRPVTFGKTLVRTLHQFSGVVQDRADSPGDTERRRLFCTAARIKMMLCINGGLVAESAAREKLS